MSEEDSNKEPDKPRFIVRNGCKIYGYWKHEEQPTETKNEDSQIELLTSRFNDFEDHLLELLKLIKKKRNSMKSSLRKNQ